ncbi:MAG: hypothetical protein KDD47_16180, partial [Acidobacteria bacterium]|nr:hypothetical protein [Acidobacteriota bacterium]
MSSLGAIIRGLGQTLFHLGWVLLLWLTLMSVAVPAGLMVAEELRQDLGPSLEHQALRDGFDMGWYGELRYRREGLAKVLEPTRLVAAGPFLDNAEAWLQGDLFREHPALLGLGALYGLLWAFLLGGALDRLARPSQLWTLSRSFESCGRYVGRMVRLALLGAPFYYLVYRLAGWLLRLVAKGAESAASETPVLLALVAVSAAVALALVAVRTVFDYAKVILVTEERSSALGAALSGAGFVLRHPIKAAGIQGGFLALGVLPVGLYHAFGPGTGQGTVMAVILAFLAGQAVLLIRLYLRLALLA